MTDPFGRLALHTWTIDNTDLKTALDAISKAGYAAAELRRTDFKRCYDAGMSNDAVLDLNRQAQAQMRAECRLHVVQGATHLFEEPGTLEEVALEAGHWFHEKL